MENGVKKDEKEKHINIYVMVLVRQQQQSNRGFNDQELSFSCKFGYKCRTFTIVASLSPIA